MKFISETSGIEKLTQLRAEFAGTIRENYEHRAKSCSTCETPGACCLDEHFVNVHISRLEAAAIKKSIGKFSEEEQMVIYERVERVIKRYGLTETGETFAKTYACPLFEKGIGCLVHDIAKPLPCIAHACYEQKEHLPPSELLTRREIEIGKLNERVYGKSEPILPIPLAIRSTKQQS